MVVFPVVKNREKGKNVGVQNDSGRRLPPPPISTLKMMKDYWKAVKGDPEEFVSLMMKSHSLNKIGREDQSCNASQITDLTKSENTYFTSNPPHPNMTKSWNITPIDTTKEEGTQLEKETDNLFSECESLNREIIGLKRQRLSYQKHQVFMAMTNKSMMRKITYGKTNQSFSNEMRRYQDTLPPRHLKLQSEFIWPENKTQSHVIYLLQTQIIELQKREQYLVEQKQEKQKLELIIREKQQLYDCILQRQKNFQVSSMVQNNHLTEKNKNILTPAPEAEGERKETMVAIGAPKWLNLDWTNHKQRNELQMKLPDIDSSITTGLEYESYLKFEDDVTDYFESEQGEGA